MSGIAIPRGLTAIVGGGGKTTLMMYLANALSSRSCVIITTSTRIWTPDCATLFEPDEREISGALTERGLVAVGAKAENGKLKAAGIPWETLADLADYVIVEADGSKGLPLKAPAAHEPVIPHNASLVIAVAGLDGVGMRICDAAHRSELYASLVGKDVCDTVECADVAKVLMSERGQRKNVRCDYAVVLNKADTGERVSLAHEIMRGLYDCETYITALNDERIIERGRCEG